MSILPKIRTKYGEPIGVELFVAFPEIYPNEKSFFDADSIAGATSLTANGTNFQANDYIVLGQFGNEKTEIVRVTSASATSISVTATVFPHNRGDLIQNIPYNQIVVSRSTDSGANFTPLTAVDIRPDRMETYIARTTDASTDIYKVQFSNSTTGLLSAASSNSTASGYADNTAYSIKKRALQQLGEKKSELITDEFLNDALNEARRVVDQDPRVLRWSFRTSFNSNIGSIIPGQWSIAVPTDLRDQNTHKNILQLRVGRQGREVTYQDNHRFRQNYWNVAHSTLNGQITVASTDIILTSSGDFDESGSLYVAAETVAGTNDAIAYTSNNEATNTVSGVTGIAGTHATGVDVWQNATFGLPTYYTIDNGRIYFDVPFADQFAGENIYMDYYKTLTAITNDASTLDEPFYEMFVSYLKYKIKYLKSNGTIDKDKDTDYKEFKERLSQLVVPEMTGQFVNFIPDMDGMY